MSKFCGKCGTENKDEYSFCKKCGTPLDFGAKAENPRAYEEFEGVSVQDLEDGIGKNSDKILKKFTNMKWADSKVSWCWPVALLSFFFGLFGSAIWFFYRKMYKVAIICLALGIALSVGRFFISRQPMEEYFKNSFGLTQELSESKESGDADNKSANEIYREFFEEYEKFVDKFSQAKQMRYASLLQTAERYISAIFFGVFAMYLYKKHIFGKIKELKERQLDEIAYKSTLTHSLGTSGGMAALGVFLWFALASLPSTLAAIFYLR